MNLLNPDLKRADKVALITGVTGQDGAYLSEFLLRKGYRVHGLKRRASQLNTQRIDHLYQDPHEASHRFTLHHGDMTDTASLIRVIQHIQPDEIYNLAAQSHVAVSFEEPEYTANSDAIGPLRLLEAIDQELSSAQVELASLINAPLGTVIPLAEIDAKNADATVLNVPVQVMEEVALAQNADLREQHYHTRVAREETRKTMECRQAATWLHQQLTAPGSALSCSICVLIPASAGVIVTTNR